MSYFGFHVYVISYDVCLSLTSRSMIISRSFHVAASFCPFFNLVVFVCFVLFCFLSLLSASGFGCREFGV